jgi:cytochrome c5
VVLKETEAMLRLTFSACLFIGASLAPAASVAAAFELKSVTVDLPVSDALFPEGPGADAINANCLVCHSAGMVLTQPASSRKEWAAVVSKMINAYKAPVNPDDVGAIVDYLTRIKGVK